MNSDCKKLTASSRYVNQWQLKQPSVKEESLTDWLLCDISEKIDGISYRQFTRTEEARQTGADWEWWFVFTDFSFRLRVQAKKISTSKDNYAAIAYTNKYGLQIEKLVADSALKNFIPFYAFYTSDDEQTMCGRRGTANGEGVFMSGAKRIYQDFILGSKNNVSVNDVLKKTVPLSCFICCPETHASDFASFLGKYFTHEKESDNSNIQVLGRYEKLPHHIESFIKLSKEELPEWFEKEFRSELEGINAIFTYDLRDR